MLTNVGKRAFFRSELNVQNNDVLVALITIGLLLIVVALSIIIIKYSTEITLRKRKWLQYGKQDWQNNKRD